MRKKLHTHTHTHKKAWKVREKKHKWKIILMNT